MYTRVVSFEWDPGKAAANVRKHGVRFAEAVGVFSDDYAITMNDEESDPDEHRFLTLGMGIKGRILVVGVLLQRRKHSNHLSSHGRVDRMQSV